MGSGGPAVELSGIVVRYPGVVAVDGVDLSVRWGEVQGLVGENGSGKSTLMRVLAGLVRPDAGTVTVDGQAVRFRAPGQAAAAGIGLVPQHPLLAENLTVVENVVLGAEPVRRGRFDGAAARRRVASLADAYGLDLDPDCPVGALSAAERHRVELLKVLHREARILVLDEPTAVLLPAEASDLLSRVAGLADQGAAVILVDHRLDEVADAADAVTVLRAGRVVARLGRDQVDVTSLAELISGESPGSLEASKKTSGLRGGGRGPSGPGRVPPARDALTVDGLVVGDTNGRRLLDGVSLAVASGEAVGVAAADGARELVEAILGTRSVASGTILLGGVDITAAPVRSRRRAGLACVTEDPETSLLLDAPVWENVLLGHEDAVSRGAWLGRTAARRRAAALGRALGLRPGSEDVAAGALSGGNQQRLMMGRELGGPLRVLVASHPTRGLDVAAQAWVWNSLAAACGEGCAVLVASADLEELVVHSDRVLVLRRGRITASMEASRTTVAELSAWLAGAEP